MANKSLSQLLSEWRQSVLNMEKLKTDIPRIIGIEAVKVVKDNFKLQGYDTGSGVNKWPPRLSATNKAYDRRTGVKGSVYQSSNPIMLQTRNLYNGQKYLVEKNKVFIGCNLTLLPYAEKMNEERQYIPLKSQGPSPKILKAVLKKINSEREKALKNFKK